MDKSIDPTLAFFEHGIAGSSHRIGKERNP